MKQQIINILEAIAKQELDKDNGKTVQSATYMDQRILINQVFKGVTYSMGQVILRLTVIDSLYSTNAAYSYFSFEEMAEKICAIGNEQAAQDYFYSVATTGKDPKELFREPYGIRKNLAEGSMQMSLLSKYAYYSLLQDTRRYPLGFPIYDRLAKESYPTVCKMLGLKKAHSLPALDTPEIGDYIECIGQLRKALFGDSKELFCGYQQYDILDAYLWRMGKFEDGNLSLLLGRTDYIQFVKNLGLEAKANEDDTKYRERMVVKYTGTPAVDSKGKFDFNKAVVCNLLKNKSLFKGNGNEVYLNVLLEHWMLFHQVKRNK